MQNMFLFVTVCRRKLRYAHLKPQKIPMHHGAPNSNSFGLVRSLFRLMLNIWKSKLFNWAPALQNITFKPFWISGGRARDRQRQTRRSDVLETWPHDKNKTRPSAWNHHIHPKAQPLHANRNAENCLSWNETYLTQERTTTLRVE